MKIKFIEATFAGEREKLLWQIRTVVRTDLDHDAALDFSKWLMERLSISELESLECTRRLLLVGVNPRQLTQIAGYVLGSK